MKKSFILGFLTATLLFSAIPVGAAVQQYILTPSAVKIVVDGVEVKDAKLPVMAYEGYNYVPAATFKGICDKIGVGFKWDGTKKEIQVSTKATTSVVKEGTIVSEEIKYTPDGLTAKLHNGTYYVNKNDITKSVIRPSENNDTYKCKFAFTDAVWDTQTYDYITQVTLSVVEKNKPFNKKVLLNISVNYSRTSPYLSDAIEYNFYLNKIYPIISKNPDEVYNQQN